MHLFSCILIFYLIVERNPGSFIYIYSLDFVLHNVFTGNIEHFRVSLQTFHDVMLNCSILLVILSYLYKNMFVFISLESRCHLLFKGHN